MADKNGTYTNDDIQVISVLMNGVWLSIQKKREEEKLKSLLEQTQSMFNGHDAVMLLIEPVSGDIVDANPAAISFYGYSREELLRMNVHDINMLDKEEADRLRMKAFEKSQKYFTFPHKLKNGDIRSVDVYACPINYRSKVHLFSIIFDVTDRERAQKELIFASYHDHLTGIYNRRFLEHALHDLDKPENYPICIIQADINGLKTINDVYGYENGDKMLIDAAKLLNDICGEYHSIVARIGGDEFGIIIPKCDETIRAAVIGKIRKKNMSGSGSQLSLSLAVGYQYKYSEEQDINDVFKAAENYLFKHKIYESSYIRNMSIELVMNALFAKSNREMEHSARVSDVAERISIWLGMSENKYTEIRTAALLHDVGKIGIPESILNKEGKLNEEEAFVIKKHPEIGWRILGCSPEYKEIADVILHHHERWDGSGYPNGLCHEDIPIESRIIAIADAFDAMISPRPYRSPLSKLEAFEEIRRCSGTQFDPSVVEAFLKPAIEEWI